MRTMRTIHTISRRANKYTELSILCSFPIRDFANLTNQMIELCYKLAPAKLSIPKLANV